MVTNKSDLIKILRTNGIKPTSQRLAILMILADRTDHPNADMVYRSLKNEHPALSLNTVYLNLESFAEKGIISKVNILHQAARFDGDTAPHHHFVCVRCKKIIDLHNLKVPRIKIPSVLGGATIFHEQLRINGICEACKV